MPIARAQSEYEETEGSGVFRVSWCNCPEVERDQRKWCDFCSCACPVCCGSGPAMEREQQRKKREQREAQLRREARRHRRRRVAAVNASSKGSGATAATSSSSALLWLAVRPALCVSAVTCLAAGVPSLHVVRHAVALGCSALCAACAVRFKGGAV